MIQTLLDIHIDVFGPQRVCDLTTRHHLSRALEQKAKHPHGLMAKMNEASFLAQFVGGRIEFKNTERQDSTLGTAGRSNALE